MTKQERIDDICIKYQRLNPDLFVNAETKIKNTSIAVLCETEGGPYQRIKAWIEKKLTELPQLSDEVADTNKLFEAKIAECLALMKERNLKYGQSWKVMKIQSIANLCEMKMNRITNMGQLNPKVRDELMDTINYCIFSLIKYDEYVK